MRAQIIADATLPSQKNEASSDSSAENQRQERSKDSRTYYHGTVRPR
jgi:hypothetical protein